MASQAQHRKLVLKGGQDKKMLGPSYLSYQQLDQEFLTWTYDLRAHVAFCFASLLNFFPTQSL